MKLRAINRVLASLLSIVTYIVTVPCAAYIPAQQRTYNFGFMNRCHDFRTAEDYSNIPVVKSLRELNQRDIAAIIPYRSLRDNEDSSHLATQILTQGLNAVFKSEGMQHSGLAQTAASVEHAVQTNVSMGGYDDSVQHNFSFKMQTSEAKAVLAYQGFADAQLSYHVGHEHELKLSMFQPITSKTKIVFDSISRKDDTIQQVSLALRF